MAALGIDFGTSNTAAGVNRDGRPHVLTLEGRSATLPTAVFLDFQARQTLYGRQAVQGMIDGLEGRFMRALKSILGTPLAGEKRQFMNERLTMIEIIARFLTEIRHRAAQATGMTYQHAISGRPVRFHSASDTRDAQALEDLQAAYKLAGFASVDFIPEPEAAARAAGGEGRILIVDIGGGTSDFTICERVGGATQILMSGGIRLGGTDFDKQLSLAHVMPLMGYGAELRNEMGSDTGLAPKAPFHDLASWEKIAFVYGGTFRRDVKRWERLANDPTLFARLGEVLEMHLGHDIAYAVEAAKIGANAASMAEINLGIVEKGLVSELTNAALQAELFSGAEAIATCAHNTLGNAGLTPDQIDRVIYVGGSSLLGIVQARIGSMFPNARHETSEVFTAVVDGLALAAQ